MKKEEMCLTTSLRCSLRKENKRSRHPVVENV